MNSVNNKILIIIVAVLIILLVGKKFLGSNSERNFRETLVELDTSQVTKMIVTPKNGEKIEFSKGSNWMVSLQNKKDEADLNMVKGMLGTMVKMKPQRLVAANEDKWGNYEVNDSLGTKVQVFANDETVANFIVGKFNFQQNTRAMSTFVRLNEEQEVYSVEGFLSSNFNQEFNNFRDKTFIKFDKEDLEQISFIYSGDSSFTLSKNNDSWLVDNVVADSTLTQNYINGIRRLQKKEFLDEFDVANKSKLYQLSITISKGDPINVSCYKNGDNYVLHSTLNNDAYFEKGTMDLFKKLFINSDELVKKELVE